MTRTLALALGLAASARAQAPYSLPWQLRPAAVGNVVRSDAAIARAQAAGVSGTTVASMLSATYALTPRAAPLLRVGVVHGAPGGDGEAATDLLNPVLGGTYLLRPRDDLRVACFLGLALPLGQGGGNAPDPAKAAALGAGVLARSGMDNAMFAVNDVVVFPGVDVAYVAGGVTAQAEVTVLELVRVRGADAQPDGKRTNLTAGLHLGWFPQEWLSLGGELRLQRWLSTPKAVELDGSKRENVTFALGPRFHVQAGGLWLRPGVAYAQSLDDPMVAAEYRIVQIDLPVAF